MVKVRQSGGLREKRKPELHEFKDHVMVYYRVHLESHPGRLPILPQKKNDLPNGPILPAPVRQNRNVSFRIQVLRISGRKK